MHVYSLQHQTAQIVLLQQMTEAADGCLVRRRSHAQVYTHEPPQRGRFVQRLFHPRIRQLQPSLNKVRPHHDRDPPTLPPLPRLPLLRPAHVKRCPGPGVHAVCSSPPASPSTAHHFGCSPHEALGRPLKSNTWPTAPAANDSDSVQTSLSELPRPNSAANRIIVTGAV